MKWIARTLLLSLVLVPVVMGVRTFSLASRQVEPATTADPGTGFGDRAAARLGEAIRFRTISTHDGGATHAAAFRAFERFLERTYPRIHETLRRERIGDHSLLFTWRGRDADAPALLLAAHQDVVPVEPGSEDLWPHPPFSGAIADGFVWGRGAIDDKASVIAILEAVDSLLTEGFAPDRTLYLAFGHDEEIGGRQGARRIAATLLARGARIAAVLDEGGAIAEGMVGFVDDPVAVVGVAEKGSVSLSLTVEGEGGHSSTPPRRSAIGILSRAVARLEASPMPARIGETTRGFLLALAPELPFPTRLLIANLWITEPVVESVFAGSPSLDAMIRTTTAVTMFHGGVKSNVLPQSAVAVVNYRILPGDSVAGVVAHVRRTVGDPRVLVAPTGATPPREPSPVSPDDGDAFRAIAGSIRAIHPDAIVVPYLVVGGTDARHYVPLTPNVYRFSPYRMGPEALARLHGTGERIRVENLEHGVRFFRTLIRAPIGPATGAR